MSFANQNPARVVHHDTFDGKGFTNENSLVNALLTKPDVIDPVITHLMGQESKKFPLSFLSEGQYGGSIGVNDVQYQWEVINKLRKADEVVSTQYGGGDKPGVGHQPFYVKMKTNWLKVQHTVTSPNGIQARVDARPTPVGSHYLYKFVLITDNPGAYCPLSELAPGSRWAMIGGANVSESLSMGNESNVVSPGKMKNQLSFLRKSYRLGGNISNKTVECRFNINGKLTNLWINWEQWQHMLSWKEMIEENCWYSKYNRSANGEIMNKDPETGLPIPYGAGLLDQIPNSDTYSFLTAKKIKNTVRDVMYGATDTGAMDVVLYTGIGGLEEFDEAMKGEARALGFSQVQGDKFIRGAGRNLILGGYFTQYEHIDGHVITVKHLPLLDHGGPSLNANRHPITGLPLSSYDMYFVDMSTYDGKRNIQMAHQNGRSMITGVLKGMAPTPMNFSGNNTNVNLATEQDVSSVHFMTSKSVLVRRNTHCFILRCDLS